MQCICCASGVCFFAQDRVSDCFLWVCVFRDEIRKAEVGMFFYIPKLCDEINFCKVCVELQIQLKRFPLERLGVYESLHPDYRRNGRKVTCNIRYEQIYLFISDAPHPPSSVEKWVPRDKRIQVCGPHLLPFASLPTHQVL